MQDRVRVAQNCFTQILGLDLVTSYQLGFLYIRQLGLLGLAVHITEMDVKCANCNASRLAAQAQVYSDMLGACLANANCKSFETWGVYDGDTWVGTDNAPLLFDTAWAKKPAYDAVLATLQAHAARRRA